jgi:preprotein translocase subunit YajC
MWISPAYAQAAAAPAGGAGLLLQMLPLVAIFVVFYFFLIRPQQKRVKEHRDMVSNLKRGDLVVTGGGLIGKVTKVDGDEAEVEVAPSVKVKVVKGTITELRSKSEPVVANDGDKK